MAVELFIYSGLATLLMGSAYVIGWMLRKVFNGNTFGGFTEIFLRLVLGLGSGTALYAAMQTHGRTVLGLLLLLLLLLLATLRRNTPNEYHLPRPDIRPVMLLIVLCVPAVITLLRAILVITKNQWLIPANDYVFYARLTYPLAVQGIETPIIETLFTSALIPQPYHYLELWANTALVQFSDMPSVFVLYLSCFSALLTILFVGYAALFEQFSNRKWVLIVCAGLALTVTGVYFPEFARVGFIGNNADKMSLPLLWLPKMVVVFIFVVLGFIFLLRGYYMPAALSWGCLPVVFISTAPGVCIAGVLWAIYLAWRRLRLRDALLIGLLFIVVAVSINVFYKIMSVMNPSYLTMTAGNAGYLAHFSELRTAFNNGLGMVLLLFIYFMPFALIVLAVGILNRAQRPWKQIQVENVAVTSTLFIGAGAISFAAIYHYVDAYQLFNNLALPVVVVALLVLLGVMLLRAKAWLVTAAILAVALLSVESMVALSAKSASMHVTYRYDPEFLQRVQQVVPQLSCIGAFVLADSDYLSVLTLHTGGQTPGMYLSMYQNNQPLVSLSQIDIDSVGYDQRFARDSTLAATMIMQSTIGHLKAELMPVDVKSDAIKAALVHKKRINFVCVSRQGKLPSTLTHLVKQVITDPVSGEKLYLLKN